MYKIDSKLLDHPLFHGPGKTHGQENKVGIKRKFGTRNRFEFGRWSHADRMQLPDVPAFVAGEAHG